MVSASSRATALLPTAVGPVITTIFGALSPGRLGTAFGVPAWRFKVGFSGRPLALFNLRLSGYALHHNPPHPSNVKAAQTRPKPTSNRLQLGTRPFTASVDRYASRLNIRSS